MMRTWRTILLVILVYTVKECESYYRDLECFQGSGGECQFREVGYWKMMYYVKVGKGNFEKVKIDNANLENLSCDYIPKIFYYFKTLQQLLVRKCGPMNLKAETFQEATIKKFIANENNYPKIEDYTFSGAEKLEELDLKRNRIQKVSQHAFTGCRKLRIVDLSENEIRELAAGSFDCPILETLNLIANEITEISDDGFKGLTNLKHLRLGYNKLTQLRKEMLEKMESLNSLGLINNQIEVLAADTFQGNRKLNEIFLQNNRLKAVADGTFLGLNLKLYLNGISCENFESSYSYHHDCVVEYDRRKSSTTPSTTTAVSTSEKSTSSTTEQDKKSEIKHNTDSSGTPFPVIAIISLSMLLILIIIILILIKRFSKTGATHDPLVSSTSTQGHGQDSSRPSELIYADLDMARGQAPASTLMSTRGNSHLEETQYATIQDVSQQSVTYASIGDFVPVVPRHLKK